MSTQVKESFGKTAIGFFIKKFSNRTLPLEYDEAESALRKITGIDFREQHHWSQWFGDQVSARVSFKRYSLKAAQVVLKHRIEDLVSGAVSTLREIGGGEAFKALANFLVENPKSVHWSSVVFAFLEVMGRMTKDEASNKELLEAMKQLVKTHNIPLP